MKTKRCFLLVVCVLSTTVAYGQSPYEHRDRGLLLGALMGGLTGGALGDKNGEALAGAAIGTAVGAVTGAAIGDSVDADVARQNAYQQQRWAASMSRAVTPDEVISMTQARLSDSVIITHIRTNGIAYQPQTADLMRMSQSGVSDVVIGAMQTARLASAATAVPVPVPAYPAPIIIEQRRYVTPLYAPRPYYAPYHHHGPPPCHSSGIHWGVTFGR